MEVSWETWSGKDIIDWNSLVQLHHTRFGLRYDLAKSSLSLVQQAVASTPATPGPLYLQVTILSTSSGAKLGTGYV